MKYANQINVLLVLLGVAAVLFSFSRTYWNPDTPLLVESHERAVTDRPVPEPPGGPELPATPSLPGGRATLPNRPLNTRTEPASGPGPTDLAPAGEQADQRLLRSAPAEPGTEPDRSRPNLIPESVAGQKRETPAGRLNRPSARQLDAARMRAIQQRPSRASDPQPDRRQVPPPPPARSSMPDRPR